MSNQGAVFENLIYESHKENSIYINRIKTRITKYKGDNEIADFYTYYKGNLIYLEAKTTASSRVNFSMLQPNQALGLMKADAWDGIHGTVVVEMREFERYFLIPIMAIEESIKGGKMSMNLQELEKNAVEIKRKEYLQFDKAYDIIVGEGGVTWKK